MRDPAVTQTADRERPQPVSKQSQQPQSRPNIADASAETTLSTGLSRPSNPVRSDITGGTLWFTGLPSAGKSTIAHALADDLREAGVDVHVLDGDDVRPWLSKGLGFSREDRDINVTRIGYVARLLSSHGVLTLVPVIAPFASARNAVRADHGENGVPFGEVFVSTSLEITEQRDVKGLYAKARRGEITGMTGIDDPYEEPTSADLVIDTGQVPLSDSVAQAKALASALLGRELP